MFSPSQALQKAAATTRWAVGMCDNFVANMFGYSASGYPTAINHWNSIPANEKHPGDMNAPAGALMFWGGGSAGHVALSDGHGGIFSTDYPSPGVVSHVSASVIGSQWHKPYLGWSIPVFQGQTGSTGAVQASDTSGVAQQAASVADPGGALLSVITGAFGGDIKDLAERAGLLLLGGVLMLVGLSQFTKGGGKKEEPAKEVTPNAVPDSEERGQ